MSNIKHYRAIIEFSIDHDEITPSGVRVGDPFDWKWTSVMRHGLPTIGYVDCAECVTIEPDTTPSVYQYQTETGELLLERSL